MHWLSPIRARPTFHPAAATDDQSAERYRAPHNGCSIFMEITMIEFELNGAAQSLSVEPDMPLLWVLREELHLTGTKFGCGAGPVWRMHSPCRWSGHAQLHSSGRRRRGQKNYVYRRPDRRHRSRSAERAGSKATYRNVVTANPGKSCRQQPFSPLTTTRATPISTRR